MMKYFLRSALFFSLLVFFANDIAAKTKETIPKEGAETDSVVKEEVDTYIYNPAGMRDPFKSLILGKQEEEEEKEKTRKKRFLKKKKRFEMRRKKIPMTPLQRFNLASLKLTVILWGDRGNYAVIETPDGRGYTVRSGDYIGDNLGQIHTIDSNQITVKEDFFDIDETVKTKFIEVKLKKEQE